MINGYNGKGLEVDLSSGKIKEFTIDNEIIKKYIGGRGLGVFFLTKYFSPNENPLSENSPLIITAGGLTGTRTPTSGRFSITFKSPLTGTITSSNSGGFWGVNFRKTGYDALIIRGISDNPVYLYISEDKAEIVKAADLWERTLPELTDTLRNRYTKSVKVLGIGPAGENQVLISAIMNDYSRAVARGGPGALMGSKKLKAIVVDGRKKFFPAKQELYEAGIQQSNKLLKSMPVTSKALPQLGTIGLLKLINDHDMLPHKNFQDVYHKPENIEKISGELLRKKFLLAKRGCFNCTITCTRKTKVGEKVGEGPEYETTALMGANLDIYELEEIALANYICNDYGMDTISFGNTVGLAMELFEKGYLTIKDTEGIDLRFGKKGILQKLAKMTALNVGFGKFIGEGAKRLSERFGAPELAMVVKGLELPGYEPRASYTQALGYATSSRGGCHLKGGYLVTLGFFGGSREVNRFLIDTAAGHVVNEQDSGCVADSLGICRFSFYGFGENELARIYSGYTGIEITPEELKFKAQIIQNIERNFNIKAGFTKKDDTLPERMFNEKIMIAGEPRAIDKESQFEKMLKKYYEIRGWDKNGYPKD